MALALNDDDAFRAKILAATETAVSDDDLDERVAQLMADRADQERAASVPIPPRTADRADLRSVLDEAFQGRATAPVRVPVPTARDLKATISRALRGR